MASILDRYGIKEVADLTFYSIDANTGRPRTPVLYIDTAKVSTVESTAETSYAQGGKGNGRLIAWDFGKEITMTIEDAVFSPKSLSIMFGDGKVSSIKKDSAIDVTKTNGKIYRTIVVNTTDITSKLVGETLYQRFNRLIKNATGIDIKLSADADVTAKPAKVAMTAPNSAISGLTYALKFGDIPTDQAAGTLVTADASQGGAVEADGKLFLSFYVSPDSAYQIDISPDSFPGTYYITADTYARSEATGADQYLQIIIPKGKITSENTLTMEADGDPTVFSMNVEVLRATQEGKIVMMQFVQYGFNDDASGADSGLYLDERINTVSDQWDFVSDKAKPSN